MRSERLDLLDQSIGLIGQELSGLRSQMSRLQDLLHLSDVRVQARDRLAEGLLSLVSDPVGVSLGDIPADLLEGLNKSLVAHEREERGLVAEQTRRRMDRELLRVFAEIKALQPITEDRSGRFVDSRLRILGENEARCEGSIGRMGYRGDVTPVIGIQGIERCRIERHVRAAQKTGLTTIVRDRHLHFGQTDSTQAIAELIP